MKVSDYVVQFLVKNGLKDVFMISGGGCIHLVDSIGKNENINYICNLHEQGAAIAAEAYAQYTGFGCALVTTGPGGTNAITGVASAYLDSIPLMIISGQVQTKDMVKDSGVRQRGFQELNLPEIVKSITKYAATVLEPRDIPVVMREAFQKMKSGRQGPVWIEIPLDIQNATIDDEYLKLFSEKVYSFSDKTPPLEIKEINDIIKDFEKAKRPVLLIGNGARESKNEIITLTKKLKIPVLTTWRAADLIEEKHPYFIGRPGMVGQRAANFVQQKSDFIMCIGARLDCGQTAFNLENFAPNAIKVIVDIDLNELKKHKNCKYSIFADSKIFLKTFLSEFASKENHIGWLKEAKRLKEKYSLAKESKKIAIYDFMHKVSELMKEGDVLIPGSSGLAAEVTLQSFQVKKSQRIINSPGLGAMGFAIPAAIGACVANDNKYTVCIDGDGSFMMNVQELELIERLDLPITIFVLNNGGYESIRKTQDRFFNSEYVGSSCDSGLSLPDFRKIVESYNLKYFLVSTFEKNWLDKIESLCKVQRMYNESCICEILLPENNEIICKTVSYQKEDGTFSSKSMENLSPELSEEEIRKVMKND
jgi:acetolactate synthase-1/2/3 large subunit